MTGSITGTASAMASGVAGVQKASAMQDEAAVSVQRSFHGPDSQSPLREASGGDGAPAAKVELSSASYDLASAMTTMMKAEAANKANIKVIKTADEMTQELINIAPQR